MSFIDNDHDYRKALQAMPEAERRALYDGTWDGLWEPPKPIGLRTHGCVETKWVPTKGRFTSLEAKDESWARYFGLGKIVTVPMELYDVRDWDNKLVGYSEMDPAKLGRNRDKWLVSVLEDDGLALRWPHEGYSRNACVKTIEVATRLCRIQSDSFVHWSVKIQDAELLARAGWLKCIGQDRIEDFCWALRRRAYERQYR